MYDIYILDTKLSNIVESIDQDVWRVSLDLIVHTYLLRSDLRAYYTASHKFTWLTNITNWWRYISFIVMTTLISSDRSSLPHQFHWVGKSNNPNCYLSHVTKYTNRLNQLTLINNNVTAPSFSGTFLSVLSWSIKTNQEAKYPSSHGYKRYQKTNKNLHKFGCQRDMLLLDSTEGQSIEGSTRVAFSASIRSTDLRETALVL